MAELNETPRGNRIHIAFFGLRNAGKSTLVNAFTGQNLAIVSDVPGTTTDPVSKAMEILPLGPCLITDTAGIDDDAGELGAMRVEKTLKVLETVDIAVWVSSGDDLSADFANWHGLFLEACRKRNVTVLEYRRGDSVEELKKKIAAIKLEERMPGLLDGLAEKGDRVVCVVPIDESAPKGRLILPQQQVIRECLDRHLSCTVCQPEELGEIIECSNNRIKGEGSCHHRFPGVRKSPRRPSFNLQSSTFSLTSFSILFARQKGDLAEYVKGLEALQNLKDGDTVLIAEGCTHHRQCNDIGSVKIPKALKKLTGKDLKFVFSSGNGFLESCASLTSGEDAASPLCLTPTTPVSLILHCGGCMLTRREVLRRIGLAKESGIPIINYGILLAKAAGITPSLDHLAT